MLRALCALTVGDNLKADDGTFGSESSSECMLRYAAIELSDVESTWCL